MKPLTVRIISIVSALALIFECVKHQNLSIFTRSDPVDSVIAIVAGAGLLLGILTNTEAQTNDPASLNFTEPITAIEASVTTLPKTEARDT